MKTLIKYFGLLVLVMSFLSACGGGGGDNPPPDNPPDTPIGELDGTWMIDETVKIAIVRYRHPEKVLI